MMPAPMQQPPPQQPQQVTPEQAVAIAVEHYNSNRFAEAESICRQVLAVAPQQQDALHVLGLVAHRVGRNDIAVQLLTRVAAQNPTRSDVLNNLGEVYRALGQADETVAG